ncbi:MAG: hypothetical protein J7M38_12135, partial [Armatimonadetes bacterium]|nr:hypothetical protein [Armatimonadota bacterium]
QVTLVCELIEAIGGESLGSFKAVGSSARGRDEVVTLEEIVDRALIEAAGNMAEKLTSFNAWSTTVMARLAEDQVMLQPLEDVEIEVPEKAIVCRRTPEGWRLIAVVEVRQANANSIHARVVSGLSAPQPNDVVVCVAR